MNKKNKKTLLILSIAVLGVFLIGYGLKSTSKNDTGVGSDKVVTVYKTPTCGCCGVYVAYLRKKGFTVKVEDMSSLSSIKSKYNIPSEMESCHTTVVGNYVVEGHVPVETINKLLTEKPDIKGIAIPGMPAGSPGMPGTKQGKFTVYSITESGNTPIYTKI